MPSPPSGMPYPQPVNQGGYSGPRTIQPTGIVNGKLTYPKVNQGGGAPVPAPGPTGPGVYPGPHINQGNFYYGGSPEASNKILNDAYFNAVQRAFNPAKAPQADIVRPDLSGANTSLMLGAGSLSDARGYAPQQQELADQLRNVANGTAGPSVAELAMQRAAGQTANQNMALAARGTGPGAVAALINAQNQNTLQQGTLRQDLGVQRALEQQQARSALAEVLAGARGQSEAEAGLYGNLGQVGGGQAIAAGGLGAQQNQFNTGQQMGQNQLNQQDLQFYYGNWLNATQGQANLLGQEEATRLAAQGGYAALQEQRRENENDRFDKYLGAGLSALGTVAAGVATVGTGGAAAPLLGASLANDARQLSDIRAKTRIAPAGDEVSQAFSPLSSSSYFYRDPNAPGAADGQHYGPMAQELEQTPAGRSVVTRMPGGKKGIDTGRLSLLNASATGRLQRKVDAIERSLRAPTTYPTVQQPSYLYGP